MRLQYHYTTDPELSFRTQGLWANSSTTDRLYTKAVQAMWELGIRMPDKIIPILDKGQFRRANPPVVGQTRHWRGGGSAYVNRVVVPPDDILPAISIGEGCWLYWVDCRGH